MICETSGMQEIVSKGSEWVLDQLQLKARLAVLGLDDGVVDALLGCAERIAGDAMKTRELETLVEWLGGGEGDAPAGGAEPLMGAVAAIACLPDLYRRQLRRGIADSIPAAVAADLQRWIYAYQREKGCLGLAARIYSWVRHQLQERIITLGRLQFGPGTFGLAHVYRRHSDGHCVALAKDGCPCDENGWPVTGGDAYVTAFSDDGQTIVGHPFRRSNGSIAAEPLRLNCSDYTRVLDPASTVLFIHIPEGRGMSPEACEESIQWAQSFFPQYYPEIEWKALVCVSWLVDPELLKVVPESSNIASFVRRFIPLTHLNANDNQLWERVFGGRVDPAAFTPKSSLQRAILEHIRQGGKFRHSGGFIAESLRSGLSCLPNNQTSMHR